MHLVAGKHVSSQDSLRRLEPRNERTVTALTPHSFWNRGMSLCAVGWLLLTPVRILTVRGVSPRTLLMPTSDLPSLPAWARSAEPAPLLKTRSIGQPQLMSWCAQVTKSAGRAFVRERLAYAPRKSIWVFLTIASAAGTSTWGFEPQICTP